MLQGGEGLTEFDYTKYTNETILTFIRPIKNQIKDFEKRNYRFHLEWTNNNKTLHFYSEEKIGIEPEFDRTYTWVKPFKRILERLLK